jgi:hypothetical protein
MASTTFSGPVTSTAGFSSPVGGVLAASVIATDVTIGSATVVGDSQSAHTDSIPDANGSVDFRMEQNYKAFLFEDFHGTWLISDAGPADLWSTTAGAGTANAGAVTVAASLNGEVTLKSASDDGTNAQNSSTFTSIGLAYKANQGGLAMEARVKIDAITAVALFIGFTDTISTTVELPIFLATADIDSDATNACGVGFDTDGTTAQFFHGGVKADVDTVPAYSGTAPVADTYFIVRVEVSAAGAVRGFINGTAIGAAVANAVTITTALTPMIVISNRGAAQRVMTIDWIKTEQNR